MLYSRNQYICFFASTVASIDKVVADDTASEISELRFIFSFVMTNISII